MNITALNCLFSRRQFSLNCRRLTRLGSRINWQYFVPVGTHPSFCRRRLTFCGENCTPKCSRIRVRVKSVHHCFPFQTGIAPTRLIMEKDIEICKGQLVTVNCYFLILYSFFLLINSCLYIFFSFVICLLRHGPPRLAFASCGHALSVNRSLKINK